MSLKNLCHFYFHIIYKIADNDYNIRLQTKCALSIPCYKKNVIDFMSDFNKKLVAKNLRAIMGRRLLSPNELAKKAEISRFQIDNILYSRALPIETLEKIARALGLKIEQLLSQEEKTKPFDTKLYSKIVIAIDGVLSFYKLQASQYTIEKILHLVYKNYNDIENLNEVIKGIILALKESHPDIQRVEP